MLGVSQCLLRGLAPRDVPHDGEDALLTADVRGPQGDLAPEQLAVLPLALPFEDLGAFRDRLPDSANCLLKGERLART